MVYSNLTEVKYRLQTAVETTAFDDQLNSLLTSAFDAINEDLKFHNLSTPASGSILTFIEADLAAAMFMEQNPTSFGDEGEAAEALRTRSDTNLRKYIDGTKEKKFFVGVNDVDSAVS